MRKVFLEQNLGKKSRCRFPKRNAKEVKIKLILEAARAVSTPAITQPLVISGVNVIEFLDRFNQETVLVEQGLKVRSKVTVNPITKTFDLELLSPSIYQLTKRLLISAKKNNSGYQLIHNLALIKILSELGSSYFLKDFISVIKQMAGNLRSYL